MRARRPAAVLLLALGALASCTTAGDRVDGSGSVGSKHVAPSTRSPKPKGVPVVVQSTEASAVSFLLPAGWRRASVTPTKVVYAPTSGAGRVVVEWEGAGKAKTVDEAVGYAALMLGRLNDPAYEYACVPDPKTAVIRHGFLSLVAQNPCGTAHARSAILPNVRDPVRPAPPGGRHRLQVSLLAAESDEDWLVLYDAPAAEADPRVATAVRGAALSQLASESREHDHLNGTLLGVGPVHAPSGFVDPSTLRLPTRAAPGAAVDDACRLVGAHDLASVPGAPPLQSTGQVPSKVGASTACQADYLKHYEPGQPEPPPTAYVGVSVFDSPLPETVRTVAAKTGSRLLGRAVTAHGLPGFVALSLAGKAPYRYVIEAFVAAGPSRTVRVTVVGAGPELSSWDEALATAQLDAVAERLASGTLQPAVTKPTRPQRGAVFAGMRFGSSTVTIDQPCRLIDVAATAKLAGGPMTAHTNEFPPTCSSPRHGVLDGGQVAVGLHGGSLADIAGDTGLAPIPDDTVTEVVNGMTVFLTTNRIDPNINYFTIEADVAISRTSWVEIFVDRRFHGHLNLARARRIRAAIVADVTERAA